MAIILCVVLLIIYLYLIYRFSKEFWLEVSENISNYVLRFFYFLTLIIPGFLLLYILKSEKFIYYWDSSNYWEKSIRFTNSLFHSPIQTLKQTYNSILHDEYNSLANLLLAPVQKIFGTLDYSTYVFSIYLIYFLPFVLVLSSLVFRLYPETKPSVKLLIPVIVTLFTPFLIPIRYGFIDIIGLLFTTMIFYLLIKSDYLSKVNLKVCFFIAVLLLLVVFSRRYYAFWVVAFFISTFTVRLFIYFKTKDKKVLINATANLFIIGSTALSVMLLLFYSFFEMSALKDYTDIYSAYRGRTLLEEISAFLSFFGIMIVAISFAGFIISFKKMKELSVFFFIFTIITLCLFTRINDFGYQHYYLIVPFFIIFFIQVIIYVSKLKKPIYYLGSITTLLLLNNILVFGSNAAYSSGFTFFSTTEGKSFFRPDYNEVLRIYNEAIKIKEEKKFIYCLSSGNLLNDSMLKNVSLPNINNQLSNLFPTQHVDKRDQFPNELFIADYVITTNPVNIHLGEENQQLITYFNHEILNGILKENYKVIKVFYLANNTEVLLLKRIEFVNNKQASAMEAHFKKLYPEYKNMYKISFFFKCISDIKLGDSYSSVAFEDNNESLIIHPGDKIPTEVTFDFEKGYKEISFTASFNNKSTIVNECDPEKDAEIYLSIMADKKLIEKIYITHKKDELIKIKLSEYTKLTFIVDKGKNEDYCDWFKISNLQLR